MLEEASLYRYPEEGESGSENPLDEHNHALAALRYLITRLDQRRMARGRRVREPEPEREGREAEARKLEQEKLLRLKYEHLWMHPGCWTSWS